MSRIKKSFSATPEEFNLNYSPAGPVSAKFHQDRSFFRGLKGPVGSGKSVSCCLEMFIIAGQRPKGISGLRKSRWVAVRNTGPELETTTIKTWLDWFPESIFGHMSRKPPITHTVRISDIEMEVIFLALDRDEDMKKLLSLEATGIWLNEARFINKSILDAATGRVGRYPSRKEKPETMSDEEWLPWYGIIADTNPPDDTHWWYNYAEEDGWLIDREGNKRDLNLVPPNQRFSFFDQPSGFSEEAENKENLPKGYYDTQTSGKTKEYIDVFLHGKYGFIQSGQPVYGSSFNEDLHVAKDPIKIIPQSTIYAGVDFGLTPCCVFAQRTIDGQWQVFAEITTPKGETISIPQFAGMLKSYIDTNLSGHRLSIYGDPSGGFRDQQGMTAYDLFRNKGIIIQAAPTNNFMPRRDAVLQPLLRLIGGKPGFLLDKSCRIVRKGFNGQYKYRKLSVSGDAKYTQEPDKNEYSHPHDALQYLMCGGGEYRELRATQKSNIGKSFVGKSWSIY
jgi:hypothetical protein